MAMSRDLEEHYLNERIRTMTTPQSSMQIGIPTDYRSYIRGAKDMLHEAAKMFRLTLGPEGHAEMCDAHKLRLELVLRALEKGESI